MSIVSSSSAQAATTSVTVPAPAEIQDGDILVAYIAAYRTTGAAPGAIVYPSGWQNNDDTLTGSYYRDSSAWKRASGETGDYTFTSTSAAQMVAGIVVLRDRLGVGDPRNNYSETAYIVNNTTLRAPTYTPAVAPANVDIVWAGFYYNATTRSTTVPTDYTAAWNQETAVLAVRMATRADFSGATVADTDSTMGASGSVKHAVSYTINRQTIPVITSIDVVTGSTAGGTTVVITGSSFLFASGVTIGAGCDVFTVDSDTQITAVTPHYLGAPGVVDVAVTGPGGVATLPAAFTYTTTPPAEPTYTGYSSPLDASRHGFWRLYPRAGDR